MNDFVKTLRKVPFYRKRLWKIAFLFLSVVLIFSASLFAYVYSQGSKVFEDGIASTFLKSLTGEDEPEGIKEGRTNIVFMGVGGSNHPGGQLTDSIMVASLDSEQKALALISIPRDLYVPVSGHKTKSKINEVMAIGEREKKGSGPALVKSTLTDLLGIPIHYYINIDFAGFEKFIDEIGGIDVLVDKTIYDPHYPDKSMKGYEPFYLKAGQHHLNGAIALKYARSRQTSSDFDRAGRQQKIVLAVKEKILSLGFLANPKKIMDTIAIAGDHVRTDISPTDIKSLAKHFKEIDNSKTITKVLSNGNNGPLVSDSSSGTYLLLPRNGDYGQIKHIAQNVFSTEQTENKADIKIEVLNGSTITGQGLKLANILKSYGYSIINIDNAKDKYQRTIIYDYSNGKAQGTIKFLKESLEADVVEKSPESTQSASISIVVGNNYTGFAQNKNK